MSCTVDRCKEFGVSLSEMVSQCVHSIGIERGMIQPVC